jgi:DNA-binding NarL/FixJ family response regulator
MPEGLLATRQRSPASPIRILIADDHPMVRDGLRALLGTQPDFDVVGDARDGEEALRLAYDMRPDVLLLDMAMPQLSGMEVLRELSAARTAPCRTILVTAALQKLDVPRVLKYGARGIVLKDSPIEMVFKSIRKVHDGEVWVTREAMTDLMDDISTPAAPPSADRIDYGLTPREREVLARLVDGDTNKEIADRLGVSEGTVKHHLTSIFTKTGATNRLELGLLALQRQLVPGSAKPSK